MRRIFYMICLIVILSGCGSRQTELELAQWREHARLDANETWEYLYEQALKEDTLVVYSDTTRIYKVRESFEKQYPGLTVEIYDMRTSDMMDALQEAYDQRTFNHDLVICSDGDGRLEMEYLEKGIVNAYKPDDIAMHIRPEAQGGLLNFTGECEQLFYNSQVYDSCPVENWWELTEPQWHGRVYMNSPLRSHPAYALLYSVVNNSKAMEDAYFQRYGEPLQDAYQGNAGMEFWKRLVENGVHFTTSSNELVEIVGAAGQENPPVAFMISSKIRRNEIGLHTKAAYGVIPCDGVYVPNSVSIAGGARNVNSAKLFIRWLLGEADGTGEGLEPYLLEGTWPVRDDVESESEITMDEADFWFNDKKDVAATRREITDFWIGLQEKAKE